MRKRPWKILKLAGSIIAAALVVAMGVCWAGIRTPGWYRPSLSANLDAQVVRDRLRDAAQQFSDALMTPGVFEVHLREDQLNEWIARRKEIYPLVDREIPSDWSDPQILFREGRIRLAARYLGVPGGIVASIDVSVGMAGEAIVLQLQRCQIGSLRIPMGMLPAGADSRIDKQRNRLWRGSPRIEGDVRTGLRVDPYGVWPNGDRAYRVLDVRVGDSVIHLRIESLGPSSRSLRSDHDDEPGLFGDN